MCEFITVLIPAYNEGTRIKNTIQAIKKSIYVDRIVVIDDGSVDTTFETAKKENAEVYRLDRNRGKGYAMNYGLDKVISNSKIIIFLDGDLQETASEVDKLIYPILEDEADFTIAKFPRAKKKGGFGLVKNLAKSGVKFYTGQSIDTTLSGQRAFKTEILKRVGNLPSGYGVEVGMTIDILNMGYRVKEVEVGMTHRETGRDLQSFLHRGKQFYHILLTLIKKI
ncbi:glycosyltransferase family 2 protein [Lutibacter sp. B2]|nr:glycosyltransferase family 2 protein [Lutibacter sp. B2]